MKLSAKDGQAKPICGKYYGSKPAEIYEDKPECSNLWSEMNGPFSKSNVFRHCKANSNDEIVRICAKKPQPLVGELHFKSLMFNVKR